MEKEAPTPIAARQALLDDQIDRQQAVGADRVGFGETLRAEHVEAGQPRAGAFDIARIVDLAGHQAGHPGEPFGIEPLGAGHVDLAVAGERSGHDGDGCLD